MERINILAPTSKEGLISLLDEAIYAADCLNEQLDQMGEMLEKHRASVAEHS